MPESFIRPVGRAGVGSVLFCFSERKLKKHDSHFALFLSARCFGSVSKMSQVDETPDVLSE